MFKILKVDECIHTKVKAHAAINKKTMREMAGELILKGLNGE